MEQKLNGRPTISRELFMKMHAWVTVGFFGLFEKPPIDLGENQSGLPMVFSSIGRLLLLTQSGINITGSFKEL
jgi:hypothetical protein